MIVDDLIASGNTLARSAGMCVARGARGVYGLATHGLFTGDACRTLADAPLNQLFVTDTVPPFRLVYGTVREKVAGPVVRRAGRRCHQGCACRRVPGQNVQWAACSAARAR
ncbi:hypothetical protein [Massilia scottii]|uniref:hypothetical protein n=1 Tax=Massilia scottii TaxID=3057166 RepID=UPI0035B569C6